MLLVGEGEGAAARPKPADLALLTALPIRADTATPRAFSEILTLTREYRLSAYDAAYRDLAIREGMPLATQDKALRRVAEVCGRVGRRLGGAFQLPLSSPHK